MTQCVCSCGSFARDEPCWNVAAIRSAATTSMPRSRVRIRVWLQCATTISSSAVRAASLCARSISARSSGSATAHSADTVLSAENVMSRPADRPSLPAFCVSADPSTGGKAAIERHPVGGFDLAAVGEVEQAGRVEPNPVRLLAADVVRVGRPVRLLAFHVIGGVRRLADRADHQPRPRSAAGRRFPRPSRERIPSSFRRFRGPVGGVRRSRGRVGPAAARAGGAQV